MPIDEIKNVCWLETVNGFTLSVLRGGPGEFYGCSIPPGTEQGVMDKDPLPTLEKAKGRAYGMMGLRLEIWMLKARETARDYFNC